MMSSIKQSAAWWCFVPAKLTDEAFVRALAEMGYSAVELAPKSAWPLIQAHGLALSGVSGHNSIVDGLNRRDQHDRIERELRAAIADAEQWRIPNLICFSGSRAGLDDKAGAAIAAEGLARVAPMAEAAGVTLVLELLNSKVDHPDYQADRTAYAIEVCQRVASPRVKVLYDIYHMQIMEGDVIRTIQEHHAEFAHYHTAGNPGRHELDESQEINYAPIFRAIKATGYNGYVVHEFIPAGDPIAGLRQAYAIGAANL